jgi:hypothetical protein
MKIYVRDLSPETPWPEFFKYSEKHGEVTDVTIGTYRVEGQLIASGLVEIPSQEQAWQLSPPYRARNSVEVSRGSGRVEGQ